MICEGKPGNAKVRRLQKRGTFVWGVYDLKVGNLEAFDKVIFLLIYLLSICIAQV